MLFVSDRLIRGAATNNYFPLWIPLPDIFSVNRLIVWSKMSANCKKNAQQTFPLSKMMSSDLFVCATSCQKTRIFSLLS